MSIYCSIDIFTFRSIIRYPFIYPFSINDIEIFFFIFTNPYLQMYVYLLLSLSLSLSIYLSISIIIYLFILIDESKIANDIKIIFIFIFRSLCIEYHKIYISSSLSFILRSLYINYYNGR